MNRLPDHRPNKPELVRALAAQERILTGTSPKRGELESAQFFPRWLPRLIAFYIAAHTLVGLALLIAAALAILRFLPLIQRISELAGA